MSRIEYKTRDQMKWMRESGLVVAEIHRPYVFPPMTLSSMASQESTSLLPVTS